MALSYRLMTGHPPLLKLELPQVADRNTSHDENEVSSLLSIPIIPDFEIA